MKEPTEEIRNFVKENKILLLIEGYDEAPDAVKDSVGDLLLCDGRVHLFVLFNPERNSIEKIKERGTIIHRQGLTDEGLESYVLKTLLPAKEGKPREFLEKLKRNKYRYALALTPFLLHLFSDIWTANRSCFESGALTPLLEEMVDKKHIFHWGNKKNDLIQRLRKYALYLVNENKQIDEEKRVKSKVPQLDKAITAGILDSRKAPEGVLVRFVHRVFQEFLAAQEIYNENRMEDYLKSVSKDPAIFNRLATFLLFLFGTAVTNLHGEGGKQLYKDFFMNCKGKHLSNKRNVLLLQCLSECPPRRKKELEDRLWKDLAIEKNLLTVCKFGNIALLRSFLLASPRAVDVITQWITSEIFHVKDDKISTRNKTVFKALSPFLGRGEKGLEKVIPLFQVICQKRVLEEQAVEVFKAMVNDASRPMCIELFKKLEKTKEFSNQEITMKFLKNLSPEQQLLGFIYTEGAFLKFFGDYLSGNGGNPYLKKEEKYLYVYNDAQNREAKMGIPVEKRSDVKKKIADLA